MPVGTMTSLLCSLNEWVWPMYSLHILCMVCVTAGVHGWCGLAHVLSVHILCMVCVTAGVHGWGGLSLLTVHWSHLAVHPTHIPCTVHWSRSPAAGPKCELLMVTAQQCVCAWMGVCALGV